eukprot:m.28219 g.28219  ORF g.28219 m.28219 type:complete len:273 (+) comp40081_c0_seq1:246-1064(+)
MSADPPLHARADRLGVSIQELARLTDTYQLQPAELDLLEQLHDRTPNTPIFLSVLFLLGKKGNVDRAVETLAAFRDLVFKYDAFAPLTEDIIADLQTDRITVVPCPPHNTSLVIVRACLEGVRPDEIEARLLIFTVLTALLDQVHAIREGVTVVFDSRDVTWGNYSLRRQRLRAEIFQNHIPARLQAALIVDPPFYITWILKVISPFLKEKIRSRFQVTTTERIGAEFSKEFLPTNLGGERVRSTAQVRERVDQIQHLLHPVSEAWKTAGSL